jgi:hypothetical protein
LISKQLLKSKRYKQALEVPFFILCRFCSLGFILYRICYYLSIYIYAHRYYNGWKIKTTFA